MKFDDVLHGLSPDRVRRIVLTDIFRAAHCLHASQKTEAPFMETVGLKAGFLLARMKAVPAVKRPLIKDGD